MTSSSHSQDDSGKQSLTTKKPKPKGPVPSLIGSSNGKPKRVEVLRKSECRRCKKELFKGDNCVEIPKVGGAHTNQKRYCDECYKAILDKTEKDLNELKII